MPKTTSKLALVLILGLVIPAYGQQQKGDIELQLQGTFSATVGADVSSNVGTITGKFAPYITTNPPGWCWSHVDHHDNECHHPSGRDGQRGDGD